MIKGAIRNYFLERYAGSSFVIRQKAAVLLWSHLILLPLMVIYFIINILRNNPRELLGIFIIAMAFIVTLICGIVLIRKGKYHAVVTFSIVVVTILAIMGNLVKMPVQIETGSNSLSVLMIAVIVYAAMFSTRRVLAFVSIIFLALTVSLYIFALAHAQPEVHFYLMSATLNHIIVVVMVFCLSYQNSLITDSALSITQQELEKNAELNQTLEQKVEERTAELKKSMARVKVLSGLLPICASCKKIRDDQGYWKRIEAYIHEHSEAQFSHGICPECAKKIYPEEYAELFPEKGESKNKAHPTKAYLDSCRA